MFKNDIFYDDFCIANIMNICDSIITEQRLKWLYTHFGWDTRYWTGFTITTVNQQRGCVMNVDPGSPVNYLFYVLNWNIEASIV